MLVRLLACAAGLSAASAVVAGEMLLFETPDFGGRRITVRGPVTDFDRTRFNDRASSIRVEGGYWLFCTDAYFQGTCRTFGPASMRRFRGTSTRRCRRVGGSPSIIRTTVRRRERPDEIRGRD